VQYVRGTRPGGSGRGSGSPARRLNDPTRALIAGLLALAACAITTVVALSTNSPGDYVVNGPVSGDNAGPAINALVHGHLGGYLTHQPTVGLTSLLIRAPFTGLASLFGGGSLVMYRFGAAACLIPLGLFAAWLIVRRRPAAVGWLPGVLAAVLLLVSPAVRDAVEAGHPEDVLAGVLVTGAVICATRGQDRWAAVLLGLAIGAQPWAVFGGPPVLASLSGGSRKRAAAIAVGVAAVVAAAAPLADPSAFMRAIHGEGATHTVNAFSFWWPVSSPIHLVSGALVHDRTLPLGMGRSAALLVGLALAAPLLMLGWRHARKHEGSCDALALLALLGVLRCAVDPTHLEYYYVAALIPLATWEVVGQQRMPVLTGLATGAVALMPAASEHAAPALVCAVSILVTVMLGSYLALRAFRPNGVGRRPAHRAGESASAESARDTSMSRVRLTG
jgi:hypothetical protein